MSEAPMNGVRVLNKETLESSLTLLSHEYMARRWPSVSQEADLYQTLNLVP